MNNWTNVMKSGELVAKVGTDICIVNVQLHRFEAVTTQSSFITVTMIDVNTGTQSLVQDATAFHLRNGTCFALNLNFIVYGFRQLQSQLLRYCVTNVNVVSIWHIWFWYKIGFVFVVGYCFSHQFMPWNTYSNFLSGHTISCL